MAVAAVLNSILVRLKARRDALEVAIIALERLAATDAPRRGRKPKILNSIAFSSTASVELLAGQSHHAPHASGSAESN